MRWGLNTHTPVILRSKSTCETLSAVASAHYKKCLVIIMTKAQLEVLGTWVASFLDGLQGRNPRGVGLALQLIAFPSCSSFPDELGPKHWSEQRFEHVMRLKQEALDFARAEWANYILVGPSTVWVEGEGVPLCLATQLSLLRPG